MTEILWDITGINGFEELIISNGHGGETIRQMTYALIYATHLVNLPAITEGNFTEFYERLLYVEPLMPTMISEGDNLVRLMPTLEDVRRHIGLKTNALYIDSLEFRKVAH